MSTPAPEFDSTALGRLACPVCHGTLRAETARILCASCLRAYPLVEGIPVLIAGRAEPAGSAEPAAIGANPSR